MAGESERVLRKFKDYNTSPARGRSSSPRRNGSTTSRTRVPSRKDGKRNVHRQRKPDPAQNGCVFLKEKMAPTKNLLIKVFEILMKGLPLGLCLFPVVMVSRQKLQDERCLAMQAVKRVIGLGLVQVLGLVLAWTRQKYMVRGDHFCFFFGTGGCSLGEELT